VAFGTLARCAGRRVATVRETPRKAAERDMSVPTAKMQRLVVSLTGKREMTRGRVERAVAGKAPHDRVLRTTSRRACVGQAVRSELQPEPTAQRGVEALGSVREGARVANSGELEALHPTGAAIWARTRDS
jgi:hypothetical protein